MRILACEYVTAGGLGDAEIPPSLAREADLMIRTLVGELCAIPGVEVVTLRDPGFPRFGTPGVTMLPSAGDFPASFRRALAAVDAAWITAPETGGALESLARAASDAGVRLLGCTPEAVRLAGTKSLTIAALDRAGVPTVPGFTDPCGVPPLPGRWVVKPDDGAGADGVRLLPDWQSAASALGEGAGRLIAQPWTPGESRSLSLLCAHGDAALLSINRQLVAFRNDHAVLTGLTVNIDAKSSSGLRSLARTIASTLPGLWGYVGVDYLQTESGPLVLEINPRLTTSYCAIAEAVGFNVAAMVLELAATGLLPDRPRCSPGRPVHLSLEAPDD